MPKSQLDLTADAADVCSTALDALKSQGQTRIDEASICELLALQFRSRAEELRTTEAKLRDSFAERMPVEFAAHVAAELAKVEDEVSKRTAIETANAKLRAKV